MNPVNIPNEIKYLTQFVGHKNKVPINLKTGANASSVDPSSWVTFHQAVTRYKMYGCDGIGFVIKPPYLGVDLDDCIENGVMNDFCKNVISKLDSYTEYSPSGTGVHIICKGTIDQAIKKDTYEVYREGRYFTMTGNVINNSLIMERTQEIKDLFYTSPTNGASNKPGWIAETLSTLQPGNLHNLSIKVIGKLHQNRWGKEDIFTLLKPHIERVGGDLVALKERIESISKYPMAESIIKEASLTNVTQQETYSISSFLALEDKVTWLVPGIISDKSLGFIAGLPETGKTWVCMDLAVECARGGGYWLGKFPVKDAKVLYIDQERWKGETKRRLSAIITAKTINKGSIESNLFIKSGTTIRLDLQHSFEAFKREIDKLKPSLIIVDSFTTFHTKEENNRKDIQEVLERVKQIRNEFGCAFLFVDHEGKSVFSDEDKTPNMAKMVGSIGKPAAAEYVLTVRKDGEGSMVYMTKSTMGPAIEPFLVKVEDIENGGIRVKAY
jgi:KaiC/GvpD/RAD55 family RecA-like ATPase